MATPLNSGEILGVIKKLKNTCEVLHNKPGLACVHQEQQRMARTEPERAAFMDIVENMTSQRDLDFITGAIEGAHLKKGTPQEFDQQNRYKTRAIKISDALNNTVVGTIEKESHKQWHHALFNLVVDTMFFSTSYGSFHDLDKSIDEAKRRMYGYWKVFHNDTNIKVALPRHMADTKDIHQTEWDESLHYTVMQAHKLYEGNISLVPRDDVAYKYRDEADQYDAMYPEDRKFKFLGTNSYEWSWNVIHKKIINDEGGNIWISRINDPEDPSRIRLVIVGGDKEDKGSIKIIGDVYGLDKEGNTVPVTFSAEEIAEWGGSRQVWQWADSNDDSWDDIDLFTHIGRGIHGAFGGTETSNRWTEKGGDFGWEEIQYLYNNYSKKANKDGYDDLDKYSFGGKYLSEWSKPGQLEMDMFVDPLYEGMMQLIKSRTKEGEEPYKPTNLDLRQAYAYVKNQLNGAPGFFKNKQSTTYFDSHFSVEPQNVRERLRARKFKLHTWQSAVRD